MTDAKVDLNAYVGKRIKFTYQPPRNSVDEALKSYDGSVITVNTAAGALLLKERGTILHIFIEIAGIDFSTFEVIEEAPRELKQKELPPTTLSSARFHLLDRHGWGLSAVNSMSDDDAFEIHRKHDHLDDGHVHAERGRSS
jgi:hypothetical protein